MMHDRYEKRNDEETNQVQFDSSEETRKRIASMITLLHETSYGLPLENNLDAKPIYLKTLSRLFVEARAKLSPQEKKKCGAYLIVIGEIRKKWGVNLYKPLNQGANNSRSNNNNYQLGWEELLGYAEEFELYLMEILDKHGFLMKDKKEKNKPY